MVGIVLVVVVVVVVGIVVVVGVVVLVVDAGIVVVLAHHTTTTKVRFMNRAQWLKMDGHGLSIRVHCTHQRLMNDAFGAVGADLSSPKWRGERARCGRDAARALPFPLRVA